MKPSDPLHLARFAALLTFPSLALMAWSVISPRPIPVVLAMTLGQVIGTAALALYVVAIILDLCRARVLGRPRRTPEV